MTRGLQLGRTSVAPTAFGLIITTTLVAVFVARASISDAALAGTLWTGVVAAVVLGVVVPVIGIRWVTVEAVADLADSRVGATTPVRLRVGAPRAFDGVSLAFRPGTWWSCEAGAVNLLDADASTRGVLTAVEVLVRSDGPIGVARVTRRVTVPLSRPWFVGPMPEPTSWTPRRGGDLGERHATAASHGGDVVRSVRPYRPGDPSHLVHWPSTARRGELVVRELEPPERPGVVVVVRDGDDERVLSETAGLGEAVLRSGGALVLCTCEGGRPVRAEVPDVWRLNRRLAASTAGPPGPAGATTPGWTTVVMRR